MYKITLSNFDCSMTLCKRKKSEIYLDEVGDDTVCSKETELDIF